MTMKTRIGILAAGLVMAALIVGAIAADMESMYSFRGTATTTARLYQLPGPCTEFVIVNKSGATNDLFVAINCTTNQMNTLMVATNAYCVTGTTPQKFAPKPPVTSFVVVTLASTADFVAGGR
jgi:hypothetical protein